MKVQIALLLSMLFVLFSVAVYAASASDTVSEFSKIVRSGNYACEEQFTILFGNGIANDEIDSKKIR